MRGACQSTVSAIPSLFPQFFPPQLETDDEWVRGNLELAVDEHLWSGVEVKTSCCVHDKVESHHGGRTICTTYALAADGASSRARGPLSACGVPSCLCCQDNMPTPRIQKTSPDLVCEWYVTGRV
jgi:hypothetical protein